MFVGAKYASRLHSPASFGAENTTHLKATFESKTATIVTYPVIFGNNIYAIAFLVHGDIAHATKNDKVFVLIVTIVADCALSIFLNDEASLVGAQLLIARVLSQIQVLLLLQLHQNYFVVHVIFVLLPKLELSKEFFFSARGIVYVE